MHTEITRVCVPPPPSRGDIGASPAPGHTFILADEYITFSGRSHVSQQRFLLHKLQGTGEVCKYFPFKLPGRHLGETLSSSRPGSYSTNTRGWVNPPQRGQDSVPVCHALIYLRCREIRSLTDPWLGLLQQILKLRINTRQIGDSQAGEFCGCS